MVLMKNIVSVTEEKPVSLSGKKQLFEGAWVGELFINS